MIGRSVRAGREVEVVTATLSQDEQAAGEVAAPATSATRRRILDGRLVVLLLLVALGSRGLLGGSLDHLALRTWATVFVAITVQALPFLALGVLVSGAIAALVSPATLARLLPRRPVVAVPAAAIAGTALPGCECASVPIAGRLASKGVTPSAALAFMLAAPAVNPIVLVAAAAATLQVVVPRSALLAVASQPALAAPALGVLAVLLAICSEADAFVAASLREFSLTARLVFLVVGPAVDVKLVAMQAGTFGRRFAARFAPLTFAVAVACALLVGRVLL